MRLFDTHAHLDDPQLRPEIDRWLGEIRNHGLVGVTSIATNATTSEACVELAESYPEIYASVGVHPNSAHQATVDDWKRILRLVEHERVVAIGETGLDLYWDDCPLPIQQDWFARHIELMQQTGKPLVVHMRDCEQEILEALRPHTTQGPIHGIMHSYCGSWETARQCLEWGMHISFAGMVTFKKSDAIREVAARVPLDRLLIETDSPYLTPHPIRGKRPNHPANVRYTAECLAGVFGMSVEEIAETTTQNAHRVFDLTG